jgi:hypothetical protein
MVRAASLCRRREALTQRLGHCISTSAVLMSQH